jgi:hypothetical protein
MANCLRTAAVQSARARHAGWQVKVDWLQKKSWGSGQSLSVEQDAAGTSPESVDPDEEEHAERAREAPNNTNTAATRLGSLMRPLLAFRGEPASRAFNESRTRQVKRRQA